MKNYILWIAILICVYAVGIQGNSVDRNAKDHLFISDTITVKKDVTLQNYFKWMDSVVQVTNQRNSYLVDEYDIVHGNSWIMDTLAHTDYYYLKDRGIYSEDSHALIVLAKGQIVVIPDSIRIRKIKKCLSNTYLDLNIPEYKLRIIEEGKEIYKFPVRVGQNGERYLAMANKVVDLRTKPGIGKIIRVNKNPSFINPKDNHRYYSTKRDDGNVTNLPLIPWLEPELNGQSFGQLIHPTTNLETLGKTYSNGCVGLRESDAWLVYYYSPLWTKVVFRYDLKGKNEDGTEIEFKNIYPGFQELSMGKEAIEESLKALDGKPTLVYDHNGENE